MKAALHFRKRRQAQTFIFFMLAFTMIMLLCGLAIDSGVLYLAKARLSRAVDGAALQAVGNSSQGTASVASIMRNFAIANYSDLQTVSATATVATSTYTLPGSQGTGTEYTYTFADATAGKDPAGTAHNAGQYKRYVQIIFQTGSGGQITSALCNARCPVNTYFMGYANGVIGGFAGIAAFQDLKVSSSATATRNPRLIMVVVDRSGSMLFQGGGAFGLPAAVVTFLNFFDTSSDYIGIVSFSSNARLEMPLTTNFLNAGTNALYDTYQVNTNVSPSVAIPGVDPEENGNVANYTNGTGNPAPPRRMKFGGQTSADEGMRLAMEQLMANSGFTNPNVLKYIVLFTDGAWNTVRTMVAAPGYTNVFVYPTPTGSSEFYIMNNSSRQSAISATFPNYTINLPSLSPTLSYYAATAFVPPTESATGFDYQDHTNDIWQSADGINEPLTSPTVRVGNPILVNNINGYIGTFTAAQNFNGDNRAVDIYSTYLSVWLQPGSVDYYYASGSTAGAPSPSLYSYPTFTVGGFQPAGSSNVLVVPGYIAEGILSDSLDLAYPDDPSNGGATYPRYRADNYSLPFMWPDDQTSTATVGDVTNYTNNATSVNSEERNFMFRNYANLLTGYYVMRPDDPAGPSTDTNTFTGAVQPLNANGPYYPSAAFYWPFDLVGIDQYQNFGLRNAVSDPDPTGTGLARFIGYSINMQSPAAAPQYAGELFYLGTGGTSVNSGTTAASTQLTSSTQWQAGAPSWFSQFTSAGLMLSDPTHNSAIGGATWRPTSFNGTPTSFYVYDSNLASELKNDSQNFTGGYISDPAGNIRRNSMAYSGRPTHYFDFSTSQWKPIPDNHTSSPSSNIALQLGNWKTKEYAWHARQAGVTIFTVGYGSDVNAAECSVLAQVANSVSVISPGSPNLITNVNSYIVGQPQGQQFYATTPSDISNDFYQVGTTISGALTQ